MKRIKHSLWQSPDTATTTSHFSHFNRGLAATLTAASLLLAAPTALMAGTQISNFDELDMAVDAVDYGDQAPGEFYSGSVRYNNEYTDWGGGVYSWSGFALSRVNAPQTPGYLNQYAVWGDGADVSGDGAYAVAFVDADWGLVPEITLPVPSLVRGLYIHNTAYTALAMRDGEIFARKFTKSNGDWLRLTIAGYDSAGLPLGEVEVMLGDFRAREFILNQWRWVELAKFGDNVRKLRFTIDGSDVGDFGLNTPAYFALDGLEWLPRPVTTVATLDDAPALPAGMDYWSGSEEHGMFRYAGVAFSNAYDSLYGSWSGFALSRVDNPDEGGWMNQFAVWGDGKDYSGSGQYAVGYYGGDYEPDTCRIDFPFDVSVDGFYVNNTAYAALSMRDGDGFAKKFGGASGNDPDWLKLTITGRDANGVSVGTVDFYLADYRSKNNEGDYIIEDWTWVDLSGFAPGVRSLGFTMNSSDVGEYGLNTPTYFALDNLTYRAVAGGSHDVDGSILDRGVPLNIMDENDNLVINPAYAGWATEVVEYAPAPGVDANWTNLGNVLGVPTGNNMETVSLGDLDATQIANGVPPGMITLGFATPIRDGAGPDFAVFENGFSVGEENGFFAELAFVEVSSDGVHFARFPNASGTPAAVGAYGFIKPRDAWNLAGKHSNGSGDNLDNVSFGTPFDLADLASHPLVLSGRVDLGRVTQVRIVDIPGNGHFVDSYGHPVYDAWVTWGSGGFDLAGVGVINAVLPGATSEGVSLSWIADQRLVGDPELAQYLDLDNDGQNALEEFMAGTDPNDAASLLRLSSVVVQNGVARVEWQGSAKGAGFDYTLQRRASLTSGDWESLEVAVPRVSGNIQSWEGTVLEDSAFFRVIIKQPLGN